MRPLALSLAFAALCACNVPPTLGSAEAARLTVSPEPTLATEPRGSAGFWITYEYTLTSADDCVQLSSRARGLVNGEPTPTLDHGGWRSSLFILRSCVPPRVFVTKEAAAAAQTEVTLIDGDESATITLQHLFGPAALTLTPPADGHVRAGSTVGVAWTPESDDRTALFATFHSATRQSDGFQRTADLNLPAMPAVGGTFTIPADAPPGLATISVAGDRIPAVTRCEGVVGCEPSFWIGAGTQDVTLQVEP